MNAEEIRETLNKIKFCIAHKIPVRLQWGEYYPAVLNLRLIKDKFAYTVEMHSLNGSNSTVTVGIDDVDWPTSGGGYICRN